MILSALKYIRYAGHPREWSIVGKNDDYAYFGNLNLLIGKNASGKSRTLNVIRDIAGILSGKVDLNKTANPTEYFELIFTNEGKEYKYILDVKDRVVCDEFLYENNQLRFDRAKGIMRDSDDKATILQCANNEIFISYRDLQGQPLYHDFVAWGESLNNYLFANQLEKSRLVSKHIRSNKKESDVLVYMFYKGRERFKDVFVSDVLSSMNELGYDLSDISILEKNGHYALAVEEEGKYLVSQQDISQGMFRALSLFITLTYTRLSDLSLCLLIDDMGEGMDFESSKKIMDILIRKINKSQIQFFMTSNERGVMNKIPLRYWSVIDRDKNKSVFYDYTNSRETFDDFKYTGLNNFDFLTTNFFRNGFGVMDEDDDNDGN